MENLCIVFFKQACFKKILLTYKDHPNIRWLLQLHLKKIWNVNVTNKSPWMIFSIEFVVRFVSAIQSRNDR